MSKAAPPVVSKKLYEFPCTECGGDAYIGFSGVREVATNKMIIGKKERLCSQCAKQRGFKFSLQKQ